MHDQFANAFYGSIAWQKCRSAYKQARGGICERCAIRGLIVPGTEVHHNVRITAANMNDPSITLNWDNLELLCKACHDAEHRREITLRTDQYGHVSLE